MKRTILMFLTLMTLFACTKKVADKVTETPIKQPVQETTPPVVTTTKAVTPKLNIPEGIRADLVVSIKRTPCFGKCPYYNVEIYETGTVVYEGFGYTKRMGKHEAYITEAGLAKIRAKANELGYLKLSNTYPIDTKVDVPDLPTTITYIRIGNDGKSIRNKFEAPKALIEFEKWLDAEIESLSFKEMKN